MSTEKRNCFIIMPLTIPQELLEKYNGEEKHFYNVLENLFIPAIRERGLEPLSPITKGSEIIQVEIIRKLVESDLVLCDMSILNPNVFFEFGIRTSLDKPIALVVDDKTQRIPFDASVINFYKYKSTFDISQLSKEIKNLSDYIDNCINREELRNAFWERFGTSPISNVKKFNTNEEFITYLLIRMKDAKKSIYDLTINKPKYHKTDEATFYSKEDYEKYLCSIEMASKKIPYHHIIMFCNDVFISEAKRLINQAGKYYQLAGYSDLPDDSPSFWSYAIIDEEEIIFEKGLAVKQPEIVSYFLKNFNCLWTDATPIKIGGKIEFENIEKLEKACLALRIKPA